MTQLGIRGVDFDTWFGLFGPAKMAPDLVTRLNTELRSTINHADMQKALDQFKIDPMPGSPEELGKLVADEIVRYAPIVKRIGATLN